MDFELNEKVTQKLYIIYYRSCNDFSLFILSNNMKEETNSAKAEQQNESENVAIDFDVVYLDAECEKIFYNKILVLKLLDNHFIYSPHTNEVDREQKFESQTYNLLSKKIKSVYEVARE